MKSVDQKCKWCDREFRSERTMIAHMCPRKRRWADRDMTHIRLAFRVYQMFYEITTTSTKSRTHEDFIRSQYYEGFVKFGRACVHNQWLNPEQYAQWLITQGKKLRDWDKDATYNEYLLEYVKKETGLRALERTILYLTQWSEEHGTQWNSYFRVVSTSRAVHDIRAARISPWVIYLSDGGSQLLQKFSDEQVNMISAIIDAGFWFQVFNKNPQDVDAVRETCQAAEL